MTDTLVFDIETQNFFTDPEVGWDNFAALKISVVGVYSYARDEYRAFLETEMEQCAEWFLAADTIVGFSINKYDVPVLNLYFQKLKNRHELNLWAKNRVDLLEIVEKQMGQRISLSRLAEANLGEKKGRHGSEAIGLYHRGELEELKKYCLKDVELTKKLYDLYLKENAFLVPDRASGAVAKVEFPAAAPETPTLI